MWVLCGLVLPPVRVRWRLVMKKEQPWALVSETQHSGNEALGLK